MADEVEEHRNLGELPPGGRSAFCSDRPFSRFTIFLAAAMGDNAAPGPLAHAPFHGVEWDVALQRSFFVVELLLQPLVELTTLQPVRAADRTMWR